MTLRNNFQNFILGGIISVALIACNSSKEDKSDTSSDSTEVSAAAVEDQPVTGSVEVFKDFDWSTVPPSSAQIGDFPYLAAPDGFYIQQGDSYTESKTGYSDFKDFNKLIIFTGNSFYNAEGKVAEIKFKMKAEEVDWNQYKYDSSVDKYLESIGAKLLGKLKINNAQKDFLNKDNDMTIYNHIVGDPYNEPVRFYALNHEKGKVMFQVFSNSASGEVGVVELEGFKQTMKAPTADQMKKDIDKNGKAVLNINFNTDKSSLLPDGEKAADEILALMKNNAFLKISIEEHTDNAGTADRNKKLSTERANTILKYLTSRGISGSRLTAGGYGAERPLVANDSDANMARNRRVELVKI